MMAAQAREDREDLRPLDTKERPPLVTAIKEIG